MTFSEILALVPEDKRGAVKAELDGAVKIASREDAEKLLKENGFVKSALDAAISIAVNAHDERFKTEKLPGLVEEELRKKNPPKDPRDIEFEKLRTKLTDMEKATIREKQRSRAIQALAAKGLPDKLAEFYLGEDDAGTDAKLAILFDNVIPWRESGIEKTLKERFGNQGTPPAGSPPAPQDLDARYAEARKDPKRLDEAFALHEQIELRNRAALLTR